MTYKELIKIEKAIYIEVWDKDTIGKDEFLGMIEIDGKDIVNGGSKEYKLKARNKKEKVKGTLTVNLKFVEKPTLSKEEFEEYSQLYNIQEKELKGLHEKFYSKTKNEISSTKALRCILEESTSGGKSILDTLMRQFDISGRNNLYEQKSEKFQTDLLKDEKLKDYIVESIWNGLDFDKNGKVSFKELLIGLNFICHGDLTEKAKFQFQIIDEDHNGFLDREELTKLAKFRSHAMRSHFEISFEQLRPTLSESGLDVHQQNDIRNEIVNKLYFLPQIVNVSVDLCIKYADKNNDGKISLEEYIHWATDEQQIFDYNQEFEQIMLPLVKNLSEKLQIEILDIMTKAFKGN
eukprot:TRINITY_DN1898_c2_g1_i1.p1 TRINITY_DN1898_c2_g1~~TRINITY_DN1898_c2_g1_i1.p1  ORF type:complete len:349 (+),score=113.56 TRINITY_DN1898_c2_g1_i1:299-1345(+)